MEGDSGKFVYFGYGSNLLGSRIRYQNPSAVCVGVARLDDFRLDFRLPSKRWGGKAATIIASPGDHVCGALWELDARHLETLDNQEGVHLGLYRRFDVQVELLDRDAGGARTGQMRRVISYQVRDEHLSSAEGDDTSNRPSAVYKRVILEGARENRLPEYYVKKLQSIPDDGSVAPAQLELPLDVRDEIPTQEEKK